MEVQIVDFLEIVFSTIGIVFIITQSSGFFEKIRNFSKKKSPKFFGKLLSCPLCLGTYMGMLSYIIHYYGFCIINYGFIGSIFSYMFYLILCPLMKKYD